MTKKKRTPRARPQPVIKTDEKMILDAVLAEYDEAAHVIRHVSTMVNSKDAHSFLDARLKKLRTDHIRDIKKRLTNKEFVKQMKLNIKDQHHDKPDDHPEH